MAPPGPVVFVLPAHNEAPRVADVVAAVPHRVADRGVVVVVVDDGSDDGTAAAARAAGATVISHPHNRGLGAAVRTGMDAAVATGASAMVFCDADGEYDPAELPLLVAPILDGEADYVVGTRFGGRIDRMHPHRRVGNLVLTRWVRWMVRRPVTDGQSGYRALSAAALGEVAIAHDYNYAQVLTVDLASKGFGYHEVPITYRFRSSGRSFVRLGTYSTPGGSHRVAPAQPPRPRSRLLSLTQISGLVMLRASPARKFGSVWRARWCGHST